MTGGFLDRLLAELPPLAGRLCEMEVWCLSRPAPGYLPGEEGCDPFFLGCGERVYQGDLTVVIADEGWPERKVFQVYETVPLPLGLADQADLRLLAMRAGGIRAHGEGAVDLLEEVLPLGFWTGITGYKQRLYPVPCSFAPIQQLLLRPGRARADFDQRGRMVTRFATESGKLSLSTTVDSQNMLTRSGLLLLKTWHLALCLANEDKQLGLDGQRFCWHQERMLEVERVGLRRDQGEKRQEMLELLTRLRFEGQLERVQIAGPLLEIEPDTRTFELEGRVREYQLVRLNTAVAEAIAGSKMFALHDKKFLRLSLRAGQLPFILYPFYLAQWRRNVGKVVYWGKPWLRLTVGTLAKNTAVTPASQNERKARDRLRAAHQQMKALGLIGDFYIEERDTVAEDIVLVSPPNHHPGFRLLQDMFESRKEAREAREATEATKPVTDSTEPVTGED